MTDIAEKWTITFLVPGSRETLSLLQRESRRLVGEASAKREACEVLQKFSRTIDSALETYKDDCCDKWETFESVEPRVTDVVHRLIPEPSAFCVDLLVEPEHVSQWREKVWPLVTNLVAVDSKVVITNKSAAAAAVAPAGLCNGPPLPQRAGRRAIVKIDI